MRTIERSCKNDKVNIGDDRNYRLSGDHGVTGLPEQCVSACVLQTSLYQGRQGWVWVVSHFRAGIKKVTFNQSKCLVSLIATIYRHPSHYPASTRLC